MNTEVCNARIESTMLGVEDHGCLTFYIMLDYDGAGQGFGGYVLDEFDEGTKRRHGTAFGTEAIRQVLDVLEIPRWENLPGTPVRVKREHNKVHAIGHYLKDQWLDLEELAKEYRGEEDS